MTFKEAAQFYWKGLVIIFYPLVLLPIFLVSDDLSNRCVYVIALVAGFWLTHALPPAITGLIPVGLFPFMSILDSKATASCYMTEASVLFLGGYFLAMAIESSNLHLRISLHVIKMIGFSPRKLHIGFSLVTMLLSMWISNSATTALMLPIVNTVLKELETNGVGKMLEEEMPTNEEQVKIADKEQNKREIERGNEEVEQYSRKPTKSTMGFFISIAYSSTIGGCGYMTGSPANLVYKGIYEITFPNLKLEGGTWLLICLPYMVITMILTIFWIELLYMGLFRPNSSTAQDFESSEEEKNIAKAYVSGKLDELGKISFHAIAVAIFFLLAVCLWLTRTGLSFPGWGELWTPYGTTIKDASVVIAIVIIMFLTPKTPNCCDVFSSDDQKKPKKHSVGLLTWKFVLQKVPWGILFLMGAGFALAEGAHRTGLSERITNDMATLEGYSSFGLMAVLSLIVGIITQLTSNTAVCSFIMPVITSVAKAADVHPQYIMFPCCIAASFAYLLPVSTPPNANVTDYIRMSTFQMIKAGIVVWIISYLVLLAIFGGILPLLIEVNKFPLDAYMPLDEGTH